MANGYKVTNPTRASLVSQLLSIYFENKAFYVQLLDSVPFNENANNYTTSASFGNKLAAILNNINGN